VRFFLKNSFGEFVRNIQAHQERLEIVRPAFDKFEVLPLWKLLDETVNQNSRDKSPTPGMAGETLRAILSGTPYPTTLFNGVSLRIRAEREITRGRAAILKAYYLKNPHPDIPKEVLTVSLNPASTNIPYTLGRLFSVLEAIQSSANPGINTTIKDKYFNSASATPSRVFPTLINLAQKHLRKLDKGANIFYSKQLTELTDKLGETFLDRLSLPQQGAFQLGYYHQTQARYTKKEEKKDA
jgi:CRISPR-associated protein Csd1